MLPALASSLGALVVAGQIAVLATPAPLPDLFPATPAPAASGTPLPQIGRTRTSFCRPIADSSVSAAQAATQNDAALNGLSATLPDLGLDDDPKPKQERKLMQLRKDASDIRLRAEDGMRATSRIRAYAQTLIEVQKRAALVAYADAFDEALRAQSTAAEDMARALVIAEGRRASFEADLQMSKAGQPGSTQILDAPGSYRVALTAVAARIEEHEVAVRRSEKAIAARSKAVNC